MCGFIGCIHDRPRAIEQTWKTTLVEMNRLITHRGPDDEGYFLDDYVSFGFRRLSIIDLEAGHQPLSYENDRYWIIFNGEIYNYIELREELAAKGYSFATHSDTEVIVALYSAEKRKTRSKSCAGCLRLSFGTSKRKRCLRRAIRSALSRFLCGARRSHVFRFGKEKHLAGPQTGIAKR
ncbi:hypothetical protein DI43_03195 [Geobacillus sp. CAMR12739]|nr:hypothetical protein DI43_03195 [Geobacillus sp. CAMR12739]